MSLTLNALNTTQILVFEESERWDDIPSRDKASLGGSGCSKWRSLNFEGLMNSKDVLTADYIYNSFTWESRNSESGWQLAAGLGLSMDFVGNCI